MSDLHTGAGVYQCSESDLRHEKRHTFLKITPYSVWNSSLCCCLKYSFSEVPMKTLRWGGIMLSYHMNWIEIGRHAVRKLWLWEISYFHFAFEFFLNFSKKPISLLIVLVIIKYKITHDHSRNFGKYRTA